MSIFVGIIKAFNRDATLLALYLSTQKILHLVNSYSRVKVIREDGDRHFCCLFKSAA